MSPHVVERKIDLDSRSPSQWGPKGRRLCKRELHWEVPIVFQQYQHTGRVLVWIEQEAKQDKARRAISTFLTSLD